MGKDHVALANAERQERRLGDAQRTRETNHSRDWTRQSIARGAGGWTQRRRGPREPSAKRTRRRFQKISSSKSKTPPRQGRVGWRHQGTPHQSRARRPRSIHRGGKPRSGAAFIRIDTQSQGYPQPSRRTLRGARRFRRVLLRVHPASLLVRFINLLSRSFDVRIRGGVYRLVVVGIPRVKVTICWLW